MLQPVVAYVFVILIVSVVAAYRYYRYGRTTPVLGSCVCAGILGWVLGDLGRALGMSWGVSMLIMTGLWIVIVAVGLLLNKYFPPKTGS